MTGSQTHVGGLPLPPSLLQPDSPIALDCRQSRSAPRVLYLRTEGWVEVAPDIETLLWRLGIDWRHRATTQRLLDRLDKPGSS